MERISEWDHESMLMDRTIDTCSMSGARRMREVRNGDEFGNLMINLMKIQWKELTECGHGVPNYPRAVQSSLV
jgi:hypothetical protein